VGKAVHPEIVRGLMITGKVFLRNMGKWLTGRKGALTAYYPEEIRADYSPINRGKHVLTQRPDGEVQCVRATCAPPSARPTASRSRPANFADRAHPKSPVRFEIDYSRCIFCGFCVEACPEDAIRMAKEVPNLPGFDRDKMWGNDGRPAQAWQPQRDPAKPYPTPQARPGPGGAAMTDLLHPRVLRSPRRRGCCAAWCWCCASPCAWRWPWSRT
jgi:NADH-quinone oxidoreductase subunit I